MRSIVSVLIFVVTSNGIMCYAQLDTLFVGFGCGSDYGHIKRQLYWPKTNKVSINVEPFNPGAGGEHRKAKRYFRKLSKLLDKRLSEVKVLVVINPLEPIYLTLDTLTGNIYKLNFKKMTGLKIVHLIGNDSDDIVEMPSDFYTTPVQIVYCYRLTNSKVLSENIKKKSNKIRVEIRSNEEGEDLINRNYSR